MSAGIYNIIAEQGETFTLSMTYTDPSDNPIDLTGYTASLSVKEKAHKRSYLVHATTSNGMITLGDDAGTIEIQIPATTMDALPAVTGIYSLDLESGNTVSRLIKGKFTVSSGA